jgi:hypothetical protein
MFSDDAVGRSCFAFLLFVAIVVYGYLLVFLFWSLPVKIFGSTIMKFFYKDVTILFFVYVLIDLFLFSPARERENEKNGSKCIQYLKGLKKSDVYDPD